MGPDNVLIDGKRVETSAYTFFKAIADGEDYKKDDHFLYFDGYWVNITKNPIISVVEDFVNKIPQHVIYTSCKRPEKNDVIADGAMFVN